MKRISHVKNRNGQLVTLVEAMADYENIQIAYNKARKCKRYRKDVLLFTKEKEENLERVRRELLELSYEPGEYRYFKVYEPRRDSIKRMKKTIRNYQRGDITKERLQKSIAGWTGHAGHADSYNLRKKIVTLAAAAEKKGGGGL